MSQPTDRPTTTLWLSGVLLALATFCGCSAPLIRSDRISQPTSAEAYADGVSPHFDGGPAQHPVPLIPDGICAACQPAIHYLGGPFAPQEMVEQYQSTIRPPHSKFHPVPTSPVFATRAEYTPPVAVQHPTRAPHHMPPTGQPMPLHHPHDRLLPPSDQPPSAMAPVPYREPNLLPEP